MSPSLNSPFTIPPLENGDRLNRFEFERRFNTMPQLKKAELIEGIVYMAAALRFRSHGQPHSAVMTWLGVYATATPGIILGDNPTVRLDLDNEPQPDAVLLIEASCGGQARISEDDYVEGAPELVIEIAASSVAIDLHDKKHAYRRNGVKEYIVWSVLDRQIHCFSLVEGEYRELTAMDQMWKSQVFPGLWLDQAALLAGQMPQVLAVLQTGIATPEHQAFVQQLAPGLP
jgi:Uma2 family endonuclease